MVGRAFLSRADPGFTLPAFERLAPPPSPDLVTARLEAYSSPDDIVADLHGRGGWVARAAIDHRRRAFTLETSPLTRLLAEVVLRPPDLRHLDAAFSSLGASPHGETSVRIFINDLFATRCETCGRMLSAEQLEWSAGAPARRQYRCTLCRDQQRLPERRIVATDPADVERATRDVGGAAVRRQLRERFPVPEGADGLVDALLDLHTDRQLVGLAAILGRVEGDLRAAPVESALRLAFLHAVLPASRLGTGPGRIPSLRIASGTIRSPLPDPWPERNPWLAFEDGFRIVRAFVQRLEGGSLGPLEARLGSDLRSLAEGPATAVVRVMTSGALPALAQEARDPGREPGTRSAARPRISLVLGQPPARFSQERLGGAYHGTCWALGREAAALLPLEPLAGPPIRAPWSWQAATLRRSLEAAGPLLAADARAVFLLEHGGGPEAMVACILGGVGAGYRVVDARLADPDEPAGGSVELVPPGGTLPPGSRNRGNVLLESAAGGRGDTGLVPGPGLFAPPERIDSRPFSASEAARTVQATAVAVLRARGEPATYERLLGEVLVGLDRSGQLRRLVLATDDDDRSGRRATPREPDDQDDAGHGMTEPPRRVVTGSDDTPPASGPPARISTRRRTPERQPEQRDPVERALALVRDELTRPDQRKLTEIEPGRWWLRDRVDREAAAIPLSDRVEWAAYSLLSTAGPLSETAFFERIAALFTGIDLPDEALVRACLASYRSAASTSERLTTGEDLRGRTAEHAELLAHLANAGHRLGMRVWIGRREQTRRVGDRLLADYLDRREREPWFPGMARAASEAIDAVDCIWYTRGGAGIVFEVEWTAMLGEVILRRHARIPPDPDLIRILVLAPERRELARHKLAASPVLRDAIEAANWHVLLWPHLVSWLEREPFELGGMEQYLGLDPAVERRAEQLGLFDPSDAVG